MKQQIPPKVFFSLLAVILAVVGIILYRQATDPIYHKEPGEDDAVSQFSKGPSPSTADSASKSEAPDKKGGSKLQGKSGEVSPGATPAKPEAGNKQEKIASPGPPSKQEAAH